MQIAGGGIQVAGGMQVAVGSIAVGRQAAVGMQVAARSCHCRSSDDELVNPPSSSPMHPCRETEALSSRVVECSLEVVVGSECNGSACWRFEPRLCQCTRLGLTRLLVLPCLTIQTDFW